MVHPESCLLASSRSICIGYARLSGHASHELQFAVAVAGFAEILRKSPYAKDLSYDLVLEVAESSAGSSAKRRELVELIKAAKRLDSQG